MSFLGLSNLFGGNTCRKCGCGDLRACVSPTTGPCWWAEEDLCSGCSGAQPDAVPPAQQYVCVGMDVASGPDRSMAVAMEISAGGTRTVTGIREVDANEACASCRYCFGPLFFACGCAESEFYESPVHPEGWCVQFVAATTGDRP